MIIIDVYNVLYLEKRFLLVLEMDLLLKINFK